MLALGTAAGVALADGRVTVTDATGAYNGTDGSGGAFTVTYNASFHANQANAGYNGRYGDNRRLGDGRDSSTSFLTFCIEENEHLTFGNDYYTQIEKSAVNGGIGGPNPDFISARTALLYLEFRAMISDENSGTVVPGGRFNGSLGPSLSTAETTAIQHAIWASENERSYAGLSTLAQSLYDWADANNNGALNGVRVLRLWNSHSLVSGAYSGNRQDLLTIVPLPPAAWAGIGSLAGVMAFGYVRRRKQLS